MHYVQAIQTCGANTESMWLSGSSKLNLNESTCAVQTAGFEYSQRTERQQTNR